MISVTSPAKKRRVSTVQSTSPTMPASALPESTQSMSPSSSRCACSRSARRSRYPARSRMGIRPHSDSNAPRPARTARSTSAPVAAGTSPTGIQSTRIDVDEHPLAAFIIGIVAQFVQTARDWNFQILALAVHFDGLLNHARQVPPIVRAGEAAGEIRDDRPERAIAVLMDTNGIQHAQPPSLSFRWPFPGYARHRVALPRMDTRMTTAQTWDERPRFSTTSTEAHPS